MPKFGFLLGAGASYPFGIPMMREFYERFYEYIRQNRAHCVGLIDQLVRGATAPADLEYLIQQLEQVRAIRSGLLALGQATGDFSNELALADELRGYLDGFLIETCESYDQNKVKMLLTQFVQLAAKRDAYIFTTNYDRLIEVAAKSLGLNCADGFEAASSRPESHWNGKFEPGVRLLKLHGSVNWYEEEGSEDLYRLERGYSLPSHEYRLTHGPRALRPLMIIPTLEKAVLKRPYAGLLTQFSDALKEIEVLVVIGNSLRDDHLRNTIIERASELDIILIHPAAANQTNMVCRQESTHALSIGIEEFISLGLDAFSRLLDALEKSPHDDAVGRRKEIETVLAEILAAVEQATSLTEVIRDQIARIESSEIKVQLNAIRSVTAPAHSAIRALLRSAALSQGDESVRLAAIDTLADVEGSAAAEVFGRIACEPGPLPVRAEAVLALKSFADDGPAKDEYRRVVAALATELPIAALFGPRIIRKPSNEPLTAAEPQC